MKRILILLIMVMGILFCCNVFVKAKESKKEIIIAPLGAIKQGQTIFIKVKTDKELVNPVFKYKGKTYRLFKNSDSEYEGMLGFSAMAKTGENQIALLDDTGFLNDKTAINVIRKKYPIQYLNISKSTAGLRATPHELRQIGKAKRTVTDEYLMAKAPYNTPARGCINSIYGLNRYYNGKPSGNYHKGVDIKAPTGERVNTITKGKVIVADFFNLHGGTVAIDHGQGLTSMYLHLSKINVEPGQVVKSGEKIGEVGSTGFSTGPHLHWGLYVNGVPVDPMQGWIKPVKLCK